jgi:hypothetical protein
MMMARQAVARFLGFVLAGAVLAIVAGCATEPENRSERPWNAPKSWEHGLPPAMFEGR